MEKTVRETKKFADKDRVDVALKKCVDPNQEGGAYRAMYMPELIDERIITADFKAPVWCDWYVTLSLKATGKTKQSNAVVVYAHVPHALSTPEGIQIARDKGLINGAGVLSNEEFYRLLDLEDNKNVFVVDHNQINNSELGVISVEKALANPQTIPLLGGRKRAELYLPKHKQIKGNGIGCYHCDDLYDAPLGRLICFGWIYYNNNYLVNTNLKGIACFLGARERTDNLEKKIN